MPINEDLKTKMLGRGKPVVDIGFPRRGAPTTEVGCANLLFGNIFVENGIRIKEFGPRRGACP